MDGWLFASVVAAACALSYIPDVLRWLTHRARRGSGVYQTGQPVPTGG